MNTESLAPRVGSNWNEVAATLRTAGLSDAEIEAVRTVPARINNRITRSLGRVKRNRTTGQSTAIELSGELVRLGQPAEIIAVFLHEVAHLAVHASLGVNARFESAHGPTWSRFARALGVPARATTTTSYTPQRAGTKTVAVCDGCGYRLQRRRALKATGRYRHTHCGGIFAPC